MYRGFMYVSRTFAGVPKLSFNIPVDAVWMLHSYLSEYLDMPRIFGTSLLGNIGEHLPRMPSEDVLGDSVYVTRIFRSYSFTPICFHTHMYAQGGWHDVARGMTSSAIEPVELRARTFTASVGQ